MTTPHPIAVTSALFLIAIVGAASSSGCGSDTGGADVPPSDDALGPDALVGSGRSVTAIIGPEGGTVALDGVILEVPPGALALPEGLTITSTTSPAPAGYEAYSAVYTFEPEGLVFALPATVTVPFAGDARLATLFWGRSAGGGFERLGGVAAAGSVRRAIDRLAAAFVANGVDYRETPDRSCAVTRLLEGRPVAPSGMALVFTAEDCQGRPITDLPGEDVVLREGDTRLSVEAQQQMFQRDGLQLFVILTLDVSSSTRPFMDALVAGAKSFIDTLEARGAPVHIGIDAFAGEAESRQWLAPTLDRALVRARLDELAAFTPLDPMSTNLFGAVLTSLARLDQAAAAFRHRNHGGAFTAGYVIVFTDGGDSAGLVTAQALATARAASPTRVLAIGLASSPDHDRATLDAIAPGAVLPADEPATLAREFANVASRIAGQAQRTFLVGYCSPKRSGDHVVSIDIQGATMQASAAYAFSAAGFGAGCGPSIFNTCNDDTACGGLGCGACDDRTSACDQASQRCVDTCAARSLCSGEVITNPQGYTQTCEDRADSRKCNDVCVDTLADPLNCGGCGRSCQVEVGEQCIDGVCACGGTDGMLCGDGCRDLAHDPASCGACGFACAADEACLDGACGCAGVNAMKCDGLCRDLAFDKDHCGGCGRACPIACEGGACSDDPPGYRKIAPGTFVMGSPEGEVGRYSNEVQHTVTLTRGFWLEATEVTLARWTEVMGGQPEHVAFSRHASCRDLPCPVNGMTYWSALAYLNALSAAEGRQACYAFPASGGCTGSAARGELSCLAEVGFVGLGCTGYRLPTEAEWEYAARAGTTGATYNGDLVRGYGTESVLDPIAWYEANSGEPGNPRDVHVRPVALKSPNAWGLYDMLGSLQEWTQDGWEADLGVGPVTDPVRPVTGLTAVRGGAFSKDARWARAAQRNYQGRTENFSNQGFRAARTIP